MIINGLHTNLFEYYDSMKKVADTGYQVLPDMNQRFSNTMFILIE